MTERGKKSLYISTSKNSILSFQLPVVAYTILYVTPRNILHSDRLFLLLLPPRSPPPETAGDLEKYSVGTVRKRSFKNRGVHRDGRRLCEKKMVYQIIWCNNVATPPAPVYATGNTTMRLRRGEIYNFIRAKPSKRELLKAKKKIFYRYFM